MSGLVLRDLNAGYKGTDVLRGVSLALAPGHCIGVLGPNGAGKSTLLKVVSGQLRPRAGVRLLGDQDVTKWRAFKLARAGVRWVGEPRPVFPTLTVAENLGVGGITQRAMIAERTEQVYELLPELRKKHRDRAASLSGGQQQMLAIGQALMTSPRFLCLDEPSIGLAPHLVLAVAELITRLTTQGVGILWAEQFPEIAVKHCTEVLVLSAGRVVSAGPAAELDREKVEAAYLGKSQAPAGDSAHA